MRIQRLFCPSCGSELDLEIGDASFYCPHCGANLQITNYGIDIIGSTRRKNNDQYNESALSNTGDKKAIIPWEQGKLLILLLVFLCIIIALTMLGLSYFDHKEQEYIDAGMIKIGTDADDFEGMKYTAVVSQLEAMGFNNIKTVCLGDAGFFIDRPDTVEWVSINGDKSFYASNYFSPDAAIIISYH